MKPASLLRENGAMPPADRKESGIFENGGLLFYMGYVIFIVPFVIVRM
jgi:hypothetical protein